MNRLFFRFFLVVMLSITLATFLVYAAISWLFGDPLEQNAALQAAPHIFLLEQFVDQAPADQWLSRLNKVREVSHVRLDLLPLKEAQAMLPGQRQQALMAGRIIIDAAHKAFFRRVDLKGNRYIGSDDDVLYAHDLPIDDALALKTEALRFVIVALVLLIPIALWSRAHWRALQALSDVADEFGRGNLAARARIKPGSSITPLAQRINQMATRIGRLLASQKDLLHAVSHELRTPIARLEFGMELLRDAAGNPQLDKRINAMQTDLAELNTLVNELLSMAKLEQEQQFLPARFILADLLAQCLAAHAHEAGAHAITVSVADDCVHAVGDVRLLARAIGNLLKNALKYGRGRIHVSAGNDGNLVCIMVDDDGLGIPEDQRERIFEPFHRIDTSRDRNTGGYGLGLAIVRQAVLLHGGVVSVGVSNLGGACFMICLPQRG
jgi:two-component system OmpR family sensor kinase